MIGYLFSLALLGCLSANDDQWHGPSNDYVLPSTSRNSMMKFIRVLPTGSRNSSRPLRAVPAMPDSDFVDLLILADASGSAQSIFEGHYEADESEPSRQRRLQDADTTYSLAIFVDKNVNTLGELGDFCFRPIMTGASSLGEFQSFFETYIPNGGWDWPENQYGALVAALKSPNTFPWMTGYAAPLVILITDSVPHFEGDSYQSQYPQLLPWGDSYDETAADDYCSGRYYPSADTVRNIVLSSGARLGQIIANPTAYNHRALSAAQWLNGYLGQSDSYVIAHEDDTDYFADVQTLLDIFRQELSGTTAAPDTALETTAPDTDLETSVPDTEMDTSAAVTGTEETQASDGTVVNDDTLIF